MLEGMRARRKHRAGYGDQECWGGAGAYLEKECFKQRNQSPKRDSTC